MKGCHLVAKRQGLVRPLAEIELSSPISASADATTQDLGILTVAVVTLVAELGVTTFVIGRRFSLGFTQPLAFGGNEIETNYRVARLQFGRFIPSPETPEAADQCVCVLGGLPYPLGQLSLFWNELVCPRVSSFAASVRSGHCAEGRSQRKRATLSFCENK